MPAGFTGQNWRALRAILVNAPVRLGTLFISDLASVQAQQGGENGGITPRNAVAKKAARGRLFLLVITNSVTAATAAAVIATVAADIRLSGVLTGRQFTEGGAIVTQPFHKADEALRVFSERIDKVSRIIDRAKGVVTVLS